MKRTTVSMILDNRFIKSNGLYRVKLRLYHETKVTLYPTIYEIGKENFDKLRVKRVSEKLTVLRNKIFKLETSAIDAMERIDPFQMEKFYAAFIKGHPELQHRKSVKRTIPESDEDTRIVPEEWKNKFSIFKEEHSRPDSISVVFQFIIQSLLFQSRIGTARSYQTAYTQFKNFKKNVRLSQVTPMYLREFEAWMINEKGLSKTTVGIYTRNMRAVFNEAIERKLVNKDDYPFGRRRYRVPNGRNIKKALNIEMIGRLYYEPAANEAQEKAKDFWFFSYYGNGMNVKDIINLKWKNIQDEMLVFERAKTELTSRGGEAVVISCFLTDDMWKIINRWGNEDRSPDNYIFPILMGGLSPIRQMELKQNFNQFINKKMAQLCKKAGIAKMVGTMETRHSTATIMKNAGVSPHFIKEMLGHTSLKTTENYLAGFEDAQKKKNAVHLDTFKKKGETVIIIDN